MNKSTVQPLPVVYTIDELDALLRTRSTISKRLSYSESLARMMPLVGALLCIIACLTACAGFIYGNKPVFAAGITVMILSQLLYWLTPPRYL